MKTLNLKSALHLLALLTFSISFSQPAYNVQLPNAVPFQFHEDSDLFTPKVYNENIIKLKQLLQNSKSLENTKFNGSAFLDENFQSALMINNTLKTKAKANLRYNVYNDEFEIQLDPNSDEFRRLPKDDQFEYVMNDEIFIVVDTDRLYSNEGIYPELGYIVELTSSANKAALYKKYIKNVISYHYDKRFKVTTLKSYFIKLGDDSIVEVELNKEKIVEAFPTYKLKLRNYIDQKNFKFKGNDKKIESQLIQLVRYYNSLN